eukprot:CAMPEP_0173103428 /NCGR_PEP_ID=MMETSP1102-20130122/38368_1 /TAXON_ID=49646 /ORGANISM="Geminigera sp., Strain Caron Lab Isolate" /LENGTH=52 /DNA_ID=CAMNT_0013998209 /DNA_START=210 /DNA_END=365 /DNA_ORIENTATION=+
MGIDVEENTSAVDEASKILKTMGIDVEGLSTQEKGEKMRNAACDGDLNIMVL